MMARAVPTPEVFVNEKRIKQLHNSLLKAFPAREYVYAIRPGQEVLGLNHNEVLINTYVLDENGERTETWSDQKTVKLPLFVEDGSHILTLEEFLEYELAFAEDEDD
jgi:hypothetical protein